MGRVWSDPDPNLLFFIDPNLDLDLKRPTISGLDPNPDPDPDPSNLMGLGSLMGLK